MAIENQRKNKVFFSWRETTAGTPQGSSNMNFEGHGLMTLPEPEYQYEIDRLKLGRGELGHGQEIQAVWTPWSYKCSRLSEVAYFLSYFQGKSYGVYDQDPVYGHELWQLLAADGTTMPTFTMEYGAGGTGNNIVIAGNIVNEFSITLASGGNGVVDATFSGFGNRHQYTGGVIAVHSAGNTDSGDEDNDFTSDPHINFKGCNVWIADAIDANLKAKSVNFAGEDLGANLVELSTLINSLTITGNNGISGEDLPRAASGGVINTWEKGDRVYTMEMNIRKNDSSINTDTLILADTQKAVEIQYSGKYVSGTDPYAIDIFFPVTQVVSGAQGDQNPTDKTIPFEIFEDSTTNKACDIFVQSGISGPYNSVPLG